MPDSFAHNLAFADAAQQRLEAGIVRAVMMLEPPHVIDHHGTGTGTRSSAARHVGQVARVDPQLQMPAEIGELRQQRLDFLQAHAVLVIGLAVAAEFVGAQPAHAGGVPLLERRWASVRRRRPRRRAGAWVRG